MNDLEISLKNVKWLEFKMSEVFKMSRGKRQTALSRKKGDIPYYSASKDNNGITDFISNPLFIDKNKIIVSTFGDVFFAKGDFTASDEMTILEYDEINKYNALFIVQTIKQNKDKFAFGWKAFSSRLYRQTILLPVDNKNKPDWLFMKKFMLKIEDEIQPNTQNNFHLLKDYRELKELEWEEFKIKDLFNIHSGVRLTKADMNFGDRPFIGATDSNNGITNFVSNTNGSIDSNVLGVNYNGSVVENFYHPYEAIFSDDVKRLTLKIDNQNKYIYLFLKTVILQQKEKYMYAYKFNAKRMERQKIMLPIDEDKNPHWDFMEQYMKRIENELMSKVNTSNLENTLT